MQLDLSGQEMPLLIQMICHQWWQTSCGIGHWCTDRGVAKRDKLITTRFATGETVPVMCM